MDMKKKSKWCCGIQLCFILSRFILPLQVLPIASRRTSTGHHPSRMTEVKHDHGSNHHRPIQGNKVPLRGNQISVPALHELNRPIDTAGIDTQHGEDHSDEQHDQRARRPSQLSLSQRPTHEIRRTRHEDRNREQLEDNPANHGVRAGVGVPVDFIGFRRRHPAADGLHDQRDHIARTEDPEVQARSHDGGLAAEELDEVTEQDVDAGREEGGSNNQGRDLHQECVGVIRTL